MMIITIYLFSNNSTIRSLVEQNVIERKQCKWKIEILGKKNALRANEQSTKTRKKRNCFINKTKTNANGLRWNTNTRDALRLTHKHTLHVIIITYTHLYRMA